MSDDDDVTRNSPPRRGRPPGSKTGCPVVSLTDARRALKSVRERARMGSAEDQRALLSYLAGGLFSVPYVPMVRTKPDGTFIEFQPAGPVRTSLLDPPEHKPADVLDFGGPDDAA
ncbi:MAG TPA: hypothetical protein PJ986_14790 [Gammaproteobacteria bacterium]|nr:hypothetical protein [Gammaproteobacteria bacterium]